MKCGRHKPKKMFYYLDGHEPDISARRSTTHPDVALYYEHDPHSEFGKQRVGQLFETNVESIETSDLFAKINESPTSCPVLPPAFAEISRATLRLCYDCMDFDEPNPYSDPRFVSDQMAKCRCGTSNAYLSECIAFSRRFYANFDPLEHHHDVFLKNSALIDCAVQCGYVPKYTGAYAEDSFSIDEKMLREMLRIRHMLRARFYVEHYEVVCTTIDRIKSARDAQFAAKRRSLENSRDRDALSMMLDHGSKLDSFAAREISREMYPEANSA